jgi:hypothetical protein
MHWPLDQVLELEHTERRLWATQVSSINQRLNASDNEEPFKSWVPEAQQW